MRISRIVSGVLVLFALTVSAQEPARQPSISVSGEAVIQVVPDEVILDVGMETSNRYLKAAKEANDTAITRALNAARKHGVPAERIQTDHLDVEPRYRRGEATGELLGYVVQKSLTVRLTEIKRFEELLTDLLDAGINQVKRIEWRTTQLRKYRDQARSMAMKAAREKAEALARDAGVTLGKAITIQEDDSGGRWWGGRSGSLTQNVAVNAGGPAAGTSVTAAGQIEVTARVNVTYAIQ